MDLVWSLSGLLPP